MKNVFLLLLLLPVIGWAQGSSRVVFLRVDRWGESGDIYQNDSMIARSPLHLLYMHTTHTPGGKYFWGIRNDNQNWGATISLSPDTNSITFVALRFVTEGRRQNTFAPGRSRYNTITPVSFLEFKEYYKNNMAMRKRLKHAGYSSPEELIKGFSVCK